MGAWWTLPTPPPRRRGALGGPPCPECGQPAPRHIGGCPEAGVDWTSGYPGRPMDEEPDT